MLTVALMKVRKDFQGNVISEEILEELPESASTALDGLATIFTDKLSRDPRFEAYCENLRQIKIAQCDK